MFWNFNIFMVILKNIEYYKLLINSIKLYLFIKIIWFIIVFNFFLSMIYGIFFFLFICVKGYSYDYNINDIFSYIIKIFM